MPDTLLYITVTLEMCVLASYRLNSLRGIVSSIKNESLIVGNSFFAPAVSTKNKKPSCCWDGGCDLRITRSEGYTRLGDWWPEDGSRAGFRSVVFLNIFRRWTKSKKKRLCQ